ncbi:hypothetical protein GN155_017800 [Alcanivorax sp. ZXX171]|nr:hypothetical protein [Alcanivorax sp. ZXX171]
MNFWTLPAVFAVLMLSGCASTPPAPSDLGNRDGVELVERERGARLFKSAEFALPGSVPDKAVLGLCLAKNVRVDSVRLSDSSKSFIGAYSGRYYNIGNSYQAQGEESTKFIAEDGSGAVARGQFKYSFVVRGLLPVSIVNVVRYTLEVSQTPEVNRYVFSDITAAQTETGNMPNTGFTPVYDIGLLHPEIAHDRMAAVASALNTCLRQPR